MTTQATGIPAWQRGIGDDFPVFDRRQGALGRPFWWANRAHKNEAGFFMASPFEEEQPWKPWEAAQVFRGETHWKAPGLSIAVLCWRTRPFYEVEKPDPKAKGGKKKDRVFLPAWPETKDPNRRVQGYTEVLCYIRNDPLRQLWRMTGDGLVGKRYREMLAEYRKGLLGWARRVHGEHVPSWAFWLSMSQEMETGAVKVTETPEGGVATLPALVLPKKTHDDLANLLWVGDDILQAGRYQRTGQVEDWLAEDAGHTRAEEKAEEGEMA